MIAGLIAPDRGHDQLDGKPVTGPGADRGVVFQNYSLLPWLTAYENVHLAVDQVFPRLDARARSAQHTEQYLAMVNLTPARDKKPVASCRAACGSAWRVARALAMDPRGAADGRAAGGAGRADARHAAGRDRAHLGRRASKTVVLITNDVDEAHPARRPHHPAVGRARRRRSGPAVAVADPAAARPQGDEPRRPRSRRCATRSSSICWARATAWWCCIDRRPRRPGECADSGDARWWPREKRRRYLEISHLTKVYPKPDGGEAVIVRDFDFAMARASSSA